ncbi:MAG TPA: ROK family protein [Fibrella sp.]
MNKVGIEIGGSKLQLYSESTDQFLRFPIIAQQGAGAILDQIDQALQHLPSRPEAIGVGFGGPVDRKQGKIIASHQVKGWSGFPLAAWLNERTGAFVRLENDANVAALAEARRGAGRGYAHVFYVTLGSGVGGGMVVNGQLYHGAAPGEAEIGLVQLDRTGRTLESACSGWALDNRIRELLAASDEQTPLRRLVGSTTNGETRFLREAMAEGDQAASALLQQYAEDLAFGLSHIVHLFHPDVIVLGGGVSLVGPLLLTAVQEAVPRFIVPTFQPPPVLCLASLHENVVPLGALELFGE